MRHLTKVGFLCLGRAVADGPTRMTDQVGSTGELRLSPSWSVGFVFLTLSADDGRSVQLAYGDVILSGKLVKFGSHEAGNGINLMELCPGVQYYFNDYCATASERLSVSR